MAEPGVAASYPTLTPLAEERHALAREHQRMIEEWEALGRELEALGGAA